MVDWKRKKVVVTGALGFIGSHLVDSLLNLGAEVLAVDYSGIREDLFPQKLSVYAETCKAHGVEPAFFDVDLQFAPKDFRRLARHADLVFHLAANFGGRGFVDNQQAECSAMFAVDQNVFRIATEEGVSGLHFASSACVYPNELQNDRSYLLKEEDAVPKYGWESADNIYGWAKLLGERQLQAFHKEKGLKCSACRFLTVYGPREYDGSHAIAALISRTVRCEDPFIVWGDGFQERGFTYVSDIVSGIIRASEIIEDGSPINLGVDWRLSIRRVVDLIHSFLDFRPKDVVYDLSKPMGPISRALDISKAKNVLGWSPRVNIEKGLVATIAWHKENPQLRIPRATLSP